MSEHLVSVVRKTLLVLPIRRGYKASFFEGGIRVPLFMKWPSGIPEAAVRNGPVTQMDILPTLAAATGALIPENLNLDGRALLSQDHDQDDLFWRNGGYRAYRKGNWKLQWLEQSDKVWLFDLATDPLEAYDLAAAEPARVNALMADLRAQDGEQAPSAWPLQLEIPLAVDKTLEQPLLEGDEHIIFSN